MKFWVAIVELGFLGYVGSLIALIWYGFDAQGRWQGRRGWWLVGAALLCFLCWLEGLRRV
ncbi:MAG TPA: hypothetical protein EYP85_04510 [Armatimonadetes bacterium]|nr:hypothetical protein [Armatimonadota bacterium]